MKRPVMLFFLIMLMVAAILLVWLAGRALDNATLVLTESDNAHDVVRGWAVALRLWPVMLTGAFPALVVAGGLALWGLFAASDADQQREITRLQQAMDTATARAEQAEHEAQARYAERNRLAEQREQQAAACMQAADLRTKEANTAIALAQGEVAKIKQALAQQTGEAWRRQRNASATAERRRRKLEKQEAASVSKD